MYFGAINRMILAELVKVFLMSLVALTGMFLLAGTIQEASRMGLSPVQILTAIPLIIPNTLPFTIPATTLFATCVVYGRMSADNEVLVLRAAGVNIYTLLCPALILGLGTTAATAALYYDTIPRSQRLLKAQFEKDAEGILYGMLKREGGLKQGGLDYVLYVRDVQGRDLIDVVIKKRKRPKEKDAKAGAGPGFEMVARAQMARLRVQDAPDSGTETNGPPEESLTAVERFQRRSSGAGAKAKELVVYMDRCYVDSLTGDAAAELRGKEYAMPLPTSIFGKATSDRPSSQTWEELFINRDEERANLKEMLEDLQRLRGGGDGMPAPATEPNAKAVFNLVNGPIRYTTESIRKIEIEIQLRPALAVGCLCFVLIGCPVGIWASRSDYLSVFIICFLPTVFFYYPLLLAGQNLAKSGKVPAWTVWAADVIALIVAFILIRRLMKR